MKTRKNLFAMLAVGAVVGLTAAAFSPVAFAGDKDKYEKGQKQSHSEAMAKVGSAAPGFTLVDTDGKSHNIEDYTRQGKVVVIEWFNAGCPFVVRHHDKVKTMADTAKKHSDKVVWLAINSGAPGKQGHGMDAEAKKNWNIPYPILLDESGSVGRLYGAKTTPHMYIVDTKGMLVYAGAIDNDPKGDKPASEKVNYVAQALDEVLAGKPVSQAETKAYGCSVKYGS